MIEPAKFVHQVNVSSDDRVANIKANAGRDLPVFDFRRIAICASGPSLADHIEDIRDRQQQGWHVASMNGSHNFLIQHGITPNFFFMVDARPVNLPFLDKANDTTAYIIASQCQPHIFDSLHGRKLFLWQMFHDQAGLDAIQEAMGERRAASFIGSLNVGHSCLAPIWALGFKVWHLFGYDGSCRGEAKHAFAQHQNDGEPIVEFFWPVGANGEALGGITKSYHATPTMAHSAQAFPAAVSQYRRLGIDIEIHGDGLIPDMVRRLSSTDGSVMAQTLSAASPIIPTPKPRKRAVERLQIVAWKWKGHIPYFAEDVNIWARMVDRWHAGPHELVVITDDDEGIDGGIRRVPLWRDQFEHGRDWHRLKIFAEEMADIIGPRFVSMDLDTVICGPIDDLFSHDAPFKAWGDPYQDQYCTALFQMDAGAFPHVWEQFDAVLAAKLRSEGIFGGYDQGWISHILPGQPRWTPADGVVSFRKDILANHDIETAPLSAKTIGDNLKIINFHGKYNPRDEAVQAALPWIPHFWQ